MSQIIADIEAISRRFHWKPLGNFTPKIETDETVIIIRNLEQNTKLYVPTFDALPHFFCFSNMNDLN